MRTRWLVALLIATMLAVVASSALADGADEYYKSAARTYWQRGADPAGCGYVTIHHYLWFDAGGASRWSTCEVWVNGKAFGVWPAGRACMIVMHEYGHGYGLPENYSDYNAVMFYSTDGWSYPYVRWPCSW